MSSNDQIAQSFTRHRRERKGFDEYPGPITETLEQAYDIQAKAMRQWDRPVAGWKVGRILGTETDRLGEDRFLGPVFADDVWQANGTDSVEFPLIPGGFAALEAELVAKVRCPETNTNLSAADCASLITAWHIGIEVAGSPLSSINALGPLASIAGFGNNMGLILGQSVDLEDPSTARCTVYIDGREFGPATAASLPGGPLAAVAFALNKLHALGQQPTGDILISTGAITGVHPVEADQDCIARFEPGGEIVCRTVALPS